MFNALKLALDISQSIIVVAQNDLKKVSLNEVPTASKITSVAATGLVIIAC